MIDFDYNNPNKAFIKVIDSFQPANFRTHEIDVNYSKELGYLQEIKDYRQNWDSYNGLTPKDISIETSIKILTDITSKIKEENTLTHLPEFCLAPDGVVGLEWDYAKGSNLFARIHSADEIEYTLTEKDNKQPRETAKSADFIKMCKEKLLSIQAA